MDILNNANIKFVYTFQWANTDNKWMSKFKTKYDLNGYGVNTQRIRIQNKKLPNNRSYEL